MTLNDKKTWCGKGYFYPEYNVKQSIKELKEYKQHDVKRNKIVIVIDEEEFDEIFGEGLI